VLTYAGSTTRYQPNFAGTKLDRVAKIRDIEAEREAQAKAAAEAAKVRPTPEPTA
jgi:hypothetical protein